MIPPLDLQRLAVRIEGLQQTSTRGWHPAEDLEFRNILFGGRDRRGHDPRVLPDPTRLRGMAEKGESPDPGIWRLWLQTVLRLEGMAHDNRPGSPRRIIRDAIRGRPPFSR